MIDLGWANTDADTLARINEMLKKCRALGHYIADVDVGPLHRGLEHVASCRKCGYVYRYDSSD